MLSLSRIKRYLDRLPGNADRVVNQMPSEVNDEIQRETLRRIQKINFDPGLIENRLHQLDREWDIERTFITNAATLTLAGGMLGYLLNRKWFLVPAAMGALLLQHTVTGSSLPMPLFRRLRYRTSREIENERMALKVLRGDFENADKSVSALSAYEAALR